MSETLRFDAREKAELAERGFVLRRGVFDAAELHEIANACEALVQRLLAEERRTKHSLGSYMFELQRKLETIVKWEPGHPDLVQGVEPFAHLNEELHRCALVRRFLEPCKDVVGEEEVILFTEKLNLKRAQKGGPIILHQDFPYWADQTAAASRVATAMLFLDDATAENGCLEVAPGSHREGLQKRRVVEGLGAMEIVRRNMTTCVWSSFRCKRAPSYSLARFWCIARCRIGRAPIAARCSTAISPPD